MKEEKIVDKKHYFIGTYREFEYFLKKYDFNPNHFVLIDRYEKCLGRFYYKGFVHFGDTAYQISELEKIIDYINTEIKD